MGRTPQPVVEQRYIARRIRGSHNCRDGGLDRLAHDIPNAAADFQGIALDPRSFFVEFPVKQPFEITERAKRHFRRDGNDHGIVGPRQHGPTPSEWADYAPIPSGRQAAKLACSRSSNLRLMSSPPP